MATRQEFEEWDENREEPTPTPAVETTQETIGARLLRSLHSSWRSMALRGKSDTTFQGSLNGLRDAVAACWQAGLPATLTRSVDTPGIVLITAHGSRAWGTCSISVFMHGTSVSVRS